MASNQTHVVSFHNVPGKITLSGKVDCIGCSIASSKVRVTRESDTILALFVNTVSNFAIEQAEVMRVYNNETLENYQTTFDDHKIEDNEFKANMTERLKLILEAQGLIQEGDQRRVRN